MNSDRSSPKLTLVLLERASSGARLTAWGPTAHRSATEPNPL